MTSVKETRYSFELPASWIVSSHRLQLKPSATRDHCTPCDFPVYILCTQHSFPALLSHRYHGAPFQSLQSSHHHCCHLYVRLSWVPPQFFVKKANSPFSYTVTKLFHYWFHKYKSSAYINSEDIPFLASLDTPSMTTVDSKQTLDAHQPSKPSY